VKDFLPPEWMWDFFILVAAWVGVAFAWALLVGCVLGIVIVIGAARKELGEKLSKR